MAEKSEAKTIPLKDRGAYPPEPQAIFFTVDGRRIGATQHTLSYLAGYSGRGEQRLTVGEFAEQVAKATGVERANLLRKPWKFTLRCASGDGFRDREIIAAKVPGRRLPKATA